MKKQIKYKVYQDGYTRRGLKGETYWLDGLEKSQTGQGNELCTADLIHYTIIPYYQYCLIQSTLILKTRLIEIEIDKECAHDGLKGGCKRQSLRKR